LETGQDCERLEKKGATEFLCRDQLLQMEQQALSQPAKGFDFFGYRFMWALQRRRNRDEEAVRIGKLLFCRLLLTEMSCRSIDQCRNADNSATLNAPGGRTSCGYLGCAGYGG
jgi:hypothetical protein